MANGDNDDDDAAAAELCTQALGPSAGFTGCILQRSALVGGRTGEVDNSVEINDFVV
jgi:hypothetical protein